MWGNADSYFQGITMPSLIAGRHIEFQGWLRSTQRPLIFTDKTFPGASIIEDALDGVYESYSIRALQNNIVSTHWDHALALRVMDFRLKADFYESRFACYYSKRYLGNFDNNLYALRLRVLAPLLNHSARRILRIGTNMYSADGSGRNIKDNLKYHRPSTVRRTKDFIKKFTNDPAIEEAVLSL